VYAHVFQPHPVQWCPTCNLANSVGNVKATLTGTLVANNAMAGPCVASGALPATVAESASADGNAHIRWTMLVERYANGSLMNSTGLQCVLYLRSFYAYLLEKLGQLGTYNDCLYTVIENAVLCAASSDTYIDRNVHYTMKPGRAVITVMAEVEDGVVSVCKLSVVLLVCKYCCRVCRWISVYLEPNKPLHM